MTAEAGGGMQTECSSLAARKMEAGPSGRVTGSALKLPGAFWIRSQGWCGESSSYQELDAPKRPSNATSIYVQEAARANIYGLTQASVAMGWAALEQARKEPLARQGKGDFINFQELVDEALKWKIIDKVSAKVIRDTAKKADKVMHVAPTDEAGALEVLDAVKRLLQLIYFAEGGF
jgi:hypothetical protein